MWQMMPAMVPLSSTMVPSMTGIPLQRRIDRHAFGELHEPTEHEKGHSSKGRLFQVRGGRFLGSQLLCELLAWIRHEV